MKVTLFRQSARKILLTLHRQSAPEVLAAALKREIEGDVLHLSGVKGATPPSFVAALLSPRVVVVGGLGVDLRLTVLGLSLIHI